MKTKSLVKITSLIASILAMTLTGCIGLKTFPQAARGGDTVALAVGSADGMARANTTAVFVSDSAPNTPINLTSGIRGIFRLYADKASSLYTIGSNTHFVVDSSGHEPWVTIMVVDLPQGLPTGSGQVRITTTATYPTIGNHINNRPISLAILPGTGTPSDLPFELGVSTSMPGDLTQMEAQPYAQVMPVFPSSTTWPAYGAIEMKMHVPTTAGTALGPAALRVLVDDMSVSTSSGLSTPYRHDSNQDLTVMLLSPTGKLRYYEPRFSIVPINNQDQVISFAGTPTITSVRYFDINGNQVAGPLPSDFVVQLR
jgi:hypothetical protein